MILFAALALGVYFTGRRRGAFWQWICMVLCFLYLLHTFYTVIYSWKF